MLRILVLGLALVAAAAGCEQPSNTRSTAPTAPAVPMN
jgi:uncharacterized lipoprotein YajG